MNNRCNGNNFCFRFDDEGYGAVQADTSLLTAGFMIVFLFIIMVLGHFNCVENKVGSLMPLLARYNGCVHNLQ